MAEIADVTVLDGAWSSERPCIIVDAEIAQRALDEGEVVSLVRQALAALELSGKNVVFLLPEAESNG